MVTDRGKPAPVRFVTRAFWVAVVLFVLAIPLVLISHVLAIGIVLCGIMLLLFYRDPKRHPPDHGIVSPADGRISVIRREDDQWRIGVFMNVYHVHVNRAPIPGRIESVSHRPGRHRPAFSKDSDNNERVDIRIKTAQKTFTVSLIAGTVARRISPYVAAGDDVQRGERIGHIAFGSRADVLLPDSYDRDAIAVNMGDTVTAGESILVEEDILPHRPEGRLE